MFSKTRKLKEKTQNFHIMYSKERSNIRLNQTRETLIPTVAILILALVPIALSVCPDANDIKPCTCDDEGLQCLRLNNSGLARVFRAPAERKAIRRVWIFQTNLTALKSDSFGEYIIRDLYLDLNQIEQVETGAFGEATKTLQSLSLARNQISKFPFGDLRQMRKLKQLGLGHNKLTVLESSTFPPSDTLESIDLSHNEISNIQPYAFSELYGVSLIDLSRNVLKEVESNSLYVRSTSRNLMVSSSFKVGDKHTTTEVLAKSDANPYPHTPTLGLLEGQQD